MTVTIALYFINSNSQEDAVPVFIIYKIIIFYLYRAIENTWKSRFNRNNSSMAHSMINNAKRRVLKSKHKIINKQLTGIS